LTEDKEEKERREEEKRKAVQMQVESGTARSGPRDHRRGDEEES